LAVIYKTVSDFIHFSAKMYSLSQTAKFLVYKNAPSLSQGV